MSVRAFSAAGATAIALAALLAAGAAVRGDGRLPDTESRLRDSVRYLLSRQSKDGGFRSETYGLLRSGQSLTPFVLVSLLEAPPAIARVPRDAVDRALAFVLRHVDQSGALGRSSDAAEDYPNYATALAVRAFALARPDGWRETIRPMVAALREQQFAEDRGWTPADAAYGGFGIGGPLRHPPYPGHVDLSMTRYLLEALRAAGSGDSEPAFARARVFLERCRDGKSGGFFFSPVVLEANKAGRTADGRPAPYGSATADGVLALLAAGAAVDDPAVSGALAWLEREFRPDVCPGPRADAVPRWDDALKGYWRAAAAKAFVAGGTSPRFDPFAPLAAAALESAAGDGSQRNANVLMKEDDPLIATAFAVETLSRCLGLAALERRIDSSSR